MTKEPSARSARRAELMSALAGEDVPVPAELPRRIPGVSYQPSRYAVPDADEEFLLCDGGFTGFLAFAAGGGSRAEELAL
jgi:hypothetical protein